MTNVEFTNNYRAVENLLYRFAIKLTKSESRAKDLLQDTALKAFTKKDSFSGTSLFKSWISTIMYNTFVNDYRSHKRRAKLVESISTKQSLTLASRHTGNAGYMQLVRADLDKHIDAIGPKSQKALKMHLAGYQYKEIGTELNIPTGTVKSRINYAREKARKSIVAMGLYAQTA